MPVRWEDGWPYVSWETGLIEQSYSLSGKVVRRDIDDADAVSFPAIDDFNSEELASYWLSLRNRNPDYVTCRENSGVLRLYGAESVAGNGNVSMILRRQTGFSFEASTKVDLHFEDNEDAAGIICFQNEKFNYRLQVTLKGKIILLQLIKAAGGDDEVLAEEVMTGGRKTVPLVMRVVAEHQKLRFEYGPDERSLNVLIDNIDASILSTDIAGGFVGTVVGMFAVAGGDYTQKKFYADFDWFRYENTGREWVC